MISSSSFPVHRIRVFDSLFKLIVELPQSVPVLPIGELLNTSLWDIFAAWMTKDELDSEVDDVGASPKATGSRVEDVESPVKPHHPALNLITCSHPPSQVQPTARLGIPHTIKIFLLNTMIIDRYSQIKTRLAFDRDKPRNLVVAHKSEVTAQI